MQNIITKHYKDIEGLFPLEYYTETYTPDCQCPARRAWRRTELTR